MRGALRSAAIGGAMRGSVRRTLACLCLATFGVSVGCSQGPVLRGQIEGLEKIAAQAERNGAARCAPRELATAKSQLEFAKLELDQGFLSRAGKHLDAAQPNAQAAYDLSPPDRCAARSLVVPKIGDRDGDGYLDPDDKCPDEPETWNGFEDLDGCPDDPDTDGDGVVDSLDACIVDPEDKDGYLDGDGCPETDNDFDAIPDTADKCPDEAEDPDGYQDEDGCPEPDNDQDTVVDVDDACPNEPGPPGGDKPGCPKQSLVVVTDKEIKITQQIHFEFDKDIIRKESFPVLDAVADVLRNTAGIRLEVQGHTDSKGQPAYNLKLSDRRAASVRKYLVGKGIAAERLVSRGYGMTKPIVANDSDANRALNRRVQFIRTESPGNTTPRK